MDPRLVIVMLLSGCAVAATQPPPERHDAGLALDPDETDLPAPPPSDLATVNPPAQPDFGSLSAPTACAPRINEVMTGAYGQPTAEFVEVFNPCAAAVDLSGWKIVYRAANNVSTPAGVDTSILWIWPAGSSIGAKQF